jgi:RHS repeat-associated protein
MVILPQRARKKGTGVNNRQIAFSSQCNAPERHSQANRDNSTTATYHVNVGSGGSRTFSYDSNGNLMSDGIRSYTWDGADRLVTIFQSGNTTTFVYDGLGRRVQEKLNGTVTKQWIWAGTELVEERDGTNAVTRRFYPQGEEINGVPYYYTRDHLGSVREMTDNAGNIRARYDYDPYGQTTKIAGDLEASFGFAGYYRHPGSGLYLTLFRAYDPNLARWLSRDPIGEAGGINLYGYVGNDPINMIDPLGLKEIGLSGGYSIRIDQWNRGSGTDFQIHVLQKGKEVGIVTSKGGFQLDHGGRRFDRPANTIPSAVRKEIRGHVQQEIKRRQIGRIGRASGAVGGALVLAGLLLNEYDGSNCENVQKLGFELGRYPSMSAADKAASALVIGQLVQSLFGNNTVATMIAIELTP